MLDASLIGDDDPVSLAVAAEVFFHGQLSKSSLRTEAAKGNLEILRIANKDFVTRSGVRAMLERCKVPARRSAKPPVPSASFHPTVTAQQALKSMLEGRKTSPATNTEVSRRGK